MKTIILPGYSPHNKDWVLEVAKNLNLPHEIRPVFWEHWTDPNKYLRPKEKSQDIIDILQGDSTNLVAKSVGSLVAAYTVEAIPQRIGKVILCGIPSVSMQRLNIFQKAFENFPAEKVIVFQNSKDPFATFEEVKNFMKKVNPKIKVIEKPLHTHDYPYFIDFENFFEKEVKLEGVCF